MASSQSEIQQMIHSDNLSQPSTPSKTNSGNSSVVGTPVRITMNDNPAYMCYQENKTPFFIYGLESSRNRLRDSIKNSLGKNSDRAKYLTIDKINNPALAFIKGTGNCPDISYKKIGAFAQKHLETVKAEYIKLPKNENTEKNIISYACNSALSMTKDYNIKIFFVLDDIDFNKLNGEHRDGYTTAELKTVHQAMTTGEDLTHITFVESNEKVELQTIKQRLENAFSSKAPVQNEAKKRKCTNESSNNGSPKVRQRLFSFPSTSAASPAASAEADRTPASLSIPGHLGIFGGRDSAANAAPTCLNFGGSLESANEATRDELLNNPPAI